MNYVQQIRSELRLSQCELAQILGVRLNSVSRWETGRRTPPAHLRLALERIAMQTVKIDVANLTENGLAMLQAAKFVGKPAELAGEIVVQVHDRDSLGCDDTARISVRDKLSWAERARRFGIAGLMGAQIKTKSGKAYVEDNYGTTRIPADDVLTGPNGDPIPTEKYIRQCETMMGGSLERTVRDWEFPHEMLAKLPVANGTGWWNECADRLFTWLEEGEFSLPKPETENELKINTPSRLTEEDVMAVELAALELSDAPEGWPPASDVDVCSLADEELRGVIFDAMVIAIEDGRDPDEAAARAVAKQINKSRLWELND